MELTSRRPEQMMTPTVFGLKLKNSCSLEKKNFSPPKIGVQKGYRRPDVKAKVSTIPKQKMPPKPQKLEVTERVRYAIDGW